jgi:hypothetical protein
MGKKQYGPRPKQFIPANPEKYNGILPIIFRSSWEVQMGMWLDKSPSCLSWSSESTIIPYFDPSKNKMRRYFIDFAALFLDNEGNKVQYYIEVKPFRETQPPKPSKRKKAKTLLYEKMTYATNQAKWEAARSWAENRGAKFIVVTEKQLHRKS